MRLPYDAILLLAFGGPESPEEVRPFLERVLRGHRVPRERFEEVLSHYRAVGGRSPLNEITLRQAEALEELLKQRGLALSTYVGLRHARPFIRDTIQRMAGDGVKRALGFVLAPFRSEASRERYENDVREARAQIAGPLEIDYCPDWHDHPLFIQAWSEEIKAALQKIDAEKRPVTPLIFTAHSVPVAMADRAPYVQQIHGSARWVAERLNHPRWSVAYQSRSGRPEEPWLEPDIGEVVRGLAAKGVAEVIVAPIGFVSDHVEVLYDLDIHARGIAEGLGMRFLRAGSLNDHPTFIRILAEAIEATASKKAK